MTERNENDHLSEPLYRGEVKRRSPAVAFLLTLICPGLGSLYVGNVFAGVLTCLIFVISAGTFVVSWNFFKFFPVLPGVVFLSGWFSASLALAVAASRESKRLGSDYVLEPPNHALVYTLVALFFYVLPLIGLARFTVDRFWFLHSVQTASMYPTLDDGDVLLVDRTAYASTLPRPGDLIVYGGPSGPYHTGRIIGVPGDSVFVQDGVPYVNNQPLLRTLVNFGDEESTRIDLSGLTEPDQVMTFAEQVADSSYLTCFESIQVGSIFSTVRLSHGEYYVLNDNRTNVDDSRQFGALPIDHIRGQPLFVWLSADDAGDIRWDRVAKLVQPTRSESVQVETTANTSDADE